MLGLDVEFYWPFFKKTSDGFFSFDMFIYWIMLIGLPSQLLFLDWLWLGLDISFFQYCLWQLKLWPSWPLPPAVMPRRMSLCDTRHLQMWGDWQTDLKLERSWALKVEETEEGLERLWTWEDSTSHRWLWDGGSLENVGRKRSLQPPVRPRWEPEPGPS
jgi:hypothetical protein